jgi:hypothetical protein
MTAPRVLHNTSWSMVAGCELTAVKNDFDSGSKGLTRLRFGCAYQRKRLQRRSRLESAQYQGPSTMQLPQTTHPHLVSIGECLGRSMQRHVVENDVVRSAFAELAFEIELANQMGVSSATSELLEPTV